MFAPTLFYLKKNVDGCFSIFNIVLGVHMLSGCWTSGKTYKFVAFLKAMGVSPVMARHIAKHKKGSIAIAFDDYNALIVTIIARGW